MHQSEPRGLRPRPDLLTAARSRNETSPHGAIRPAVPDLSPQVEPHRDGDRLAPASASRGRMRTSVQSPPTSRRAVNAEKAEAPTIREIIRRDPRCASPETSLRDLAQTLLDDAVSGVIIVDAQRRPLGVVTKTDILRVLAEPEVERHAATPGDEGVANHHGAADALPARVAMRPGGFCLREGAAIAQAAALMAFEGVHQIAILDDVGRVAGVISSRDVMRWLARREGYLIP